MNAQRWFQRKEDYQPRQAPPESPFRKFDVKCLACGSHQLKLIGQFNEEDGEFSVILICNRCPQREVMPIRNSACR